MERSQKFTDDVPGGLTAVVMAKAAVPGRVKTRLTRGDGALSADQAAGVHAAMLDTVLRRIGAWADRRVLAMDHPAPGNIPAAARDGQKVWRVTEQGDGDLGERLERVWRDIPGGVVFFGVDSPDVPASSWSALEESLRTHDAAVGPVGDGGYWTLAARSRRVELVRGIDWGGAGVYDQTRRAAEAAGVTLAELPPWHDVDDPADLAALRRRLIDAEEPALIDLARRLDTILD
ncbi:MAG: DUF2064 domain-containing protein [Planctomycetota bacterium]